VLTASEIKALVDHLPLRERTPGSRDGIKAERVVRAQVA
jgi:hypothetical protein